MPMCSDVQIESSIAELVRFLFFVGKESTNAVFEVLFYHRAGCFSNNGMGISERAKVQQIKEKQRTKRTVGETERGRGTLRAADLYVHDILTHRWDLIHRYAVFS